MQFPSNETIRQNLASQKAFSYDSNLVISLATYDMINLRNAINFLALRVWSSDIQNIPPTEQQCFEVQELLQLRNLLDKNFGK